MAGHEQDVQSIRPSEYYAVSGSVAFGEESSDLTPTALVTIRDIASKVRGMNLVVDVRGHVSSVEALRGAERSMKLSSDRALVVALLAHRGLSIDVRAVHRIPNKETRVTFQGHGHRHHAMEVLRSDLIPETVQEAVDNRSVVRRPKRRKKR